MKCRSCGKWCHWQCFRTPVGLFDSRLKAGIAESLRKGDTRRHDFVCPACNFEAIMLRAPVRSKLEDCYLIVLDVQTTIDEYHYDAGSYANGCRDALNKTSRWGRDLGVPTMIAYGPDEVQRMHHDHRQFSWYCIDQTASLYGCKKASKWSTAKKHRSAMFNNYDRMGLSPEYIPTNQPAFTHRMHGLLQRPGDDPEQALVFTDVCLEDLVTLMRADYERARGDRKVELAQANFALHAYTQAGLRANELFEQKIGVLKDSFVFGAAAVRQRVRPHLRLRTKCQTKENRFAPSVVLCAYAAKTSPLKTGLWAQVVIAELQKRRNKGRDDMVFAHANNEPWVMGWFWDTHMRPRLEQLKRERMGGLESIDLDKFGTNSFRRTWNTLAGQHPDPVSKDLRDRQARWRQSKRSREEMSSLYFGPKLDELLLATYWV